MNAPFPVLCSFGLICDHGKRQSSVALGIKLRPLKSSCVALDLSLALLLLLILLRPTFASTGYGPTNLKVYICSRTTTMHTTLQATQEYLDLYTGRNGNNDALFEQLKNKLLHAGCLCITEDDYAAPPSDATTVHGVARFEHHVRRKEQLMAIVNGACGIELRVSAATNNLGTEPANHDPA